MGPPKRPLDDDDCAGQPESKRPQTKDSEKIKVTCISDTHALHDGLHLGGGDILIHSGDFTVRGTREELTAFAQWIKQQNYTHKVVIAGNHELSLDRSRYEKKLQKFANKPTILENMKRTCDPEHFLALLRDAGCTYLEDSGTEIMGYKFYGTPHVPVLSDWAFMMDQPSRRAKFQQIPSETDILITHTPPQGILDSLPDGTVPAGSKKRVGCPALKDEVLTRVKPMYHVFGHIHHGYGSVSLDGTTFINAASCNDDYQCSNAPLSFLLEKRL